MKVSLNTVKQYIDFELPPKTELVARINEQLGQVEEVIDLSAKYKDAVIVKVVEAEQHPDADRLRVCKVDDGGVTQDVPRDDNGYVQVVCGAPNARAGILAVWLPPKSIVPASFDEPEPFVLAARELRGVMSQGMLAASDELAIGTDHDGIIEIDPDEWKPGAAPIVPGANFATVYGLDDTIIDIENKMFTHRPDCFGQIGVAREIAGILGHEFKSPDWYTSLPVFGDANELELNVRNEAGDNVPRFMAVAMKNISVGPSPLWLQCALVALGAKSINNIVDVTNYVMLTTAQPTHAYDYDKLRGHELVARMAQPGETATLLNGKSYTFDASDIVIADAEGVVGLGGIMGGSDSEVSIETKNIVLEVATFDMYAVRKSSMRHGIFTDALTRFNKGQSPLQNDHVLQLLMTSIGDVSSAEQASNVFDLHGERVSRHEIRVTPSFINARLGLELSNDTIVGLLRNVEVEASNGESSLVVPSPFWRTDLELPEDIVEEVGRLYGFNTLPRELPLRSMRPAAKNTTRDIKQRARDALSRAGANEVLTYSFVHENVLARSGQDVAKAFALGNALSPDLQYFRLSLLPSLLDKVHSNIKAGHDEFLLFEIGKAHHKDELDDEGLPREFGRIAGVYANKKTESGAAYFRAKRTFEQLVTDFRVEGKIRYQRLSDFDYGPHDAFRQLAAPFDPSRASVVWIGERLGGVIGEFRQSVTKNFKLPAYAAGFELFVSLFEYFDTVKRGYEPLSRYPSVTQDISLRIDQEAEYAALEEAVLRVANEPRDTASQVAVSPVAIYQEDGANDRSVTFRITVTNHERTLKSEEVKLLLDAIATAAAQTVNAQLVE